MFRSKDGKTEKIGEEEADRTCLLVKSTANREGKRPVCPIAVHVRRRRGGRASTSHQPSGPGPSKVALWSKRAAPVHPRWPPGPKERALRHPKVALLVRRAVLLAVQEGGPGGPPVQRVVSRRSEERWPRWSSPKKSGPPAVEERRPRWPRSKERSSRRSEEGGPGGPRSKRVVSAPRGWSWRPSRSKKAVLLAARRRSQWTRRGPPK